MINPKVHFKPVLILLERLDSHSTSIVDEDVGLVVRFLHDVFHQVKHTF